MRKSFVSVRQAAVAALATLVTVGARADGTSITVPTPSDLSPIVTGAQSIYIGAVGLALLALATGAVIMYVRKGLSGRK